MRRQSLSPFPGQTRKPTVAEEYNKHHRRHTGAVVPMPPAEQFCGGLLKSGDILRCMRKASFIYSNRMSPLSTKVAENSSQPVTGNQYAFC